MGLSERDGFENRCRIRCWIPFVKTTNLAILFVMGIKYSTSSNVSPSVRELPPVTATALKNSTADVLDQVIAEGAVAITRHDKPRAVLLSIEQYERMTGEDAGWLTSLQEECRDMLDKMQEPEQKAAAKRLFEATPEELGAAAVRAAKRKGSYRA